MAAAEGWTTQRCNTPRNQTDNLKLVPKELVDIGDRIDKNVEERKAAFEPSAQLMGHVSSDTAEAIKVDVACHRLCCQFLPCQLGQRVDLAEEECQLPCTLRPCRVHT